MGDMRMYQDERRLDFHALGREIKRKREAKGWTQEYLAQLVDRTPRSIMYFENRGQHPSLNTFYQIVTLLDISVDQFFYPDRQNSESDCRQHIDRLLNSNILLCQSYEIIYHVISNHITLPTLTKKLKNWTPDARPFQRQSLN
jgi:transcriptional regulator with XRE-family HTH domain